MADISNILRNITLSWHYRHTAFDLTSKVKNSFAFICY